jgi:magnesium transporter
LSDPKSAEAPEFRAASGLQPELIAGFRDAIAGREHRRLLELAAPLHAADIAELIEMLDPDERSEFVQAIRTALDPEVLVELAPDVREEVTAKLDTADLAAAIARLDSDDALYLIANLDAARQSEVLAAIPSALQRILLEGMRLPAESAGRLMRRDVIAVPGFWRVSETQGFLKTSPDVSDEVHNVFVVDPRHRPIGVVPLIRLLRRDAETAVLDIADAHPVVIPATLDRGSVAEAFRRRDLVSAPVVDPAGRLVGVITVDDVVDVIDEEAEQELMRFGGLGESDFHATAIETARRRRRWLSITLVNTVLASVVVAQFENSIQHLVALAVLMPIVAAMGGNAGMQVVTVIVRALATRELVAANAGRAIRKELAAGTLNGVAFALILSALAGIWSRDLGLALVLASAMVLNVAWASLAGTLIPLTLSRLGIDPATAAGPLLTTTTDVFGFLAFLGLATLFLI